MKIKKIFILFAAFCFCLVGCGKINTLKEIKKRGSLLVAIEDNCFPNVFKNPDSENQNDYIGLDIDIIKRVADNLSLKIKFVEQNGKSATKLLEENKADIAVSGIPIDESVKAKFLCSTPYDSAAMYVVTKRGVSYPTIGSMTGKNVGVTTEFTSNFFKKAGETLGGDKNKKLFEYKDIESVRDAIIKDEIDAFLCYEHHALELRKNEDLKADNVGNVPKEQYVFLVFKTNNELNSRINDAIMQMQESEELSELKSKYSDEELYKATLSDASNQGA